MKSSLLLERDTENNPVAGISKPLSPIFPDNVKVI
jgi:hypothetical protein